jgi:hypothetical protein
VSNADACVRCDDFGRWWQVQDMVLEEGREANLASFMSIENKSDPSEDKTIL